MDGVSMTSAGLLTGNEIKTLGLISEPSDDGYRGASYDVHIGSIIIPGELAEGPATYRLDPQGVVEVISREHVTLPNNLAGYAMVKTSLCDDGILALNIGIIDPLWKGPVSTTLLNFSNRPYALSRGQVFLRLTFHRCGDVVPAQPQALTTSDYRVKKQQKALEFGSTFLNLEENIERISGKIFWKYVAWAALVIAVTTIVSSFAIGLVAMVFSSREHTRAITPQEANPSSLATPADVGKIVNERLAAERALTSKELAATEARLEAQITRNAPKASTQTKGSK
jgi:dUTPase